MKKKIVFILMIGVILIIIFSKLEINTFSKEKASGLVYVLGYSEIVKMNSPYDDESYNYVFFHIIDTKSNEFLDYIEELQGNSYVREKAIGLGCLNNEIISYVNDSNEIGSKSFELSNKSTNAIINSSISNPIKLKLTKKALSYGGEAPLCYSHITNIKVLY
jgi:hypothetical protein